MGIPVVNQYTEAEERQGAIEVGKGGCTILVVEDIPEVRSLALTILKRLGYQTQEAEDGPSALDVLEHKDDVDLVFSDVVMPGGMSGIDLAEEIDRRYEKIRVLLTSGYSINDFDEDGFLKDRFDLLRKPYSSIELAAAVKAVIEG